MGQATGFGGSRFSRAHQQKNMRLIAIVGFVLMSGLAIGVPLFSRPATVVVPVAPTPIPLTQVFMPVQRIAIGAQLTPLMFKKDGMSPVAIVALGGEPVKSEAELVGKYARTLIMPGRPLMSDQLMDTPDNAITRKIRPGFRAITVQVNNVTGIEGWGAPGTRVDVLWESSSEENEQLVTTIVKNAQILSVAGKTDSQSQNPVANAPTLIVPGKGLPLPGATNTGSTSTPDKVFTVTLLVSPEDGQKIFLATRSGAMSLMLRGDFDVTQETNTQASVTTKRLMQGGERKGKPERVEGVAKARRQDGSFEEWSVIEGRVWRWDQGQSSTTWAQ